MPSSKDRIFRLAPASVGYGVARQIRSLPYSPAGLAWKLCLLCCLFAGPGHAQSVALDRDAAAWRAELHVYDGLPSTNFDRNRDIGLSVVFDYELPFLHSPYAWMQRASFAFRLRPIMYHHQQEADSDLYGMGLGAALRLYQNPDRKTGFYGELAEELLVHAPKFSGNSTHFNFLTQFGLGYQFSSNWFVTLRLQHASNARLGSRNSGIDSLGLAAGWRFP